jgi:N-alpha-acetyltransferase 15/16, NatA auxiliary subunit
MANINDSSNPQAGAGRPLPKKEADLFKSVVKHYEQKQYKKAIKQADTILKKFPKHGETLAMKGLTLNYMSKRYDAHTLVKEGLMNDMR